MKEEDWKTLKILNVKTEDYKNCLVLKAEDLATKPTKPEDRRFPFLTGKIWLLSVINWEDGSWWYLPHWFWLRGSRKPSRLPLCPWRCHLKKTAIGHWGGMDPDCMKSWNFEFESLWVDKEMHIFIWGFISSGSGTWISSNLSHSGHKNRQLQEMKINKNNCCRKDRNDFS